MSSLTRQRLSNGLLGVSILGGLVAFVLSILLLIAGTALTGHDAEGRPSNVLLKDFALVSFDGIVADNDTSSFLVHLHWFASAFAWEYPAAPSSLPAAGFASHGPRMTLDTLDDLHNIATALGIPRDDWDCPSPGRFAEPCSNVFFEAWRTYFYSSFGGLTGFLMWIMLLAAAILATTTILQEWAIKQKPYWMRCRCFVLKRYCPCPTGTKEEIEALDEHAWDKVRLSYWGMVMLYFLLPLLHGLITIHFFKDYLRYIDQRLPEGLDLNVTHGAAVKVALWVAFGASALSFSCILVKWWMSRRARGWMEQQALRELQIDRGDDDDATPATEDGAPKYTD